MSPKKLSAAASKSPAAGKTKASGAVAPASTSLDGRNLSTKNKEIFRKAKALFHLTGPVNLALFFPGFVVGEALIKDGIAGLNPCYRTEFEEALPEKQALVCTAAVFALALASLTGGCLMLRSAMAHIEAAGGTIAPNDPPLSLVVTGPYAYVRNPVALAQLMILISEGILIGIPKVLVLAGLYTVYILVNTAWSEEPSLRARFGPEWVHYKFAVDAWCPRCSPWQPGREQV